ncbi:hypothetical protein [Micromonospora lupini]|uniref:hypothetical protein n=1 Tax=Micromonospora lupini TaxID=285679 RepID=UPI0033F0689A
MVWFTAEYRALITGVSLAAASDDAELALHRGHEDECERRDDSEEHGTNAAA